MSDKVFISSMLCNGCFNNLRSCYNNFIAHYISVTIVKRLKIVYINQAKCNRYTCT